ncbi:cyclic nucleotide-gated ion channel 2-like isoform X3 [Ipomoea triloba]|uniref:cyclic nucleotide-gated ion channel 2-like isoform X3 n=1 Tax=Ipomoea triloba TaxID=35885 RepID=UPI00125D9EC7|nr:cyclic nucleotide-gated ion channel 2-like isoform X3 [Ipomoea triloba]
MPPQTDLHFSLSRWLGVLFGRRSVKPYNSDESTGENQIAGDSSTAAVECYACTQVGVPVFHSTSCDEAHQPEWQASAGSSFVPIQNRPGSRVPAGKRSSGGYGLPCRALDPRSKRVQRLNRAFLLARGMSIAVDPLFFYALSIGVVGSPCLYMDGGMVAAVTVLRTCVDAVHLCHLWLQFRVAYVSRESLVIGCGKLVWDTQAIASHYVRSLKGFWFDVFVILPVPQVVFWLVVPKLIRDEEMRLIMTILLLFFLFQFLPKVYHSICLMRRMQKVTGYLFGTIWWGFALNLIVYFIASHVAGGCWYVLAIQRVAACLRQQCGRRSSCNRSLSCSEGVCYRFPLPTGSFPSGCAGNSTTPPINNTRCLDANGPFAFGIYESGLAVISSSSITVKILYPIFWGLQNLSTFGNMLEPTSNWLEVIFCICIVLCGLMLFTLLIGNIQVFLHAAMSKKRKMQLRCRDLEWWMRRRQLPSHLRERVQNYERYRWSTMGGQDEMKLIKDLPDGLRRDIKRYLCRHLIKKVPLFHDLDGLVLDNICDRLQPLVFSRGEKKMIREGDPVVRLVFIVRGRIKSTQILSKEMVATSMIGPGSFLGDELISWCLRRPFNDRLPPSYATFTCIEPTEAYGLDSGHLRFVADHFRYRFANDRLKRTARYYSTNWRTWAAVNIQLAWRRYVLRTTRRPVNVASRNGGDCRLRQYAAMFMSFKPHDHLE